MLTLRKLPQWSHGRGIGTYLRGYLIIGKVSCFDWTSFGEHSFWSAHTGRIRSTHEQVMRGSAAEPVVSASKYVEGLKLKLELGWSLAANNLKKARQSHALSSIKRM